MGQWWLMFWSVRWMKKYATKNMIICDDFIWEREQINGEERS